jgi:hypothetical protein
LKCPNSIPTSTERYPKAFVLSILGTMLCVLFGAFSECAGDLYDGQANTALLAHQAISLKALSGKRDPLRSADSGDDSLFWRVCGRCEEAATSSSSAKKTVSRYILGKELACAISGF